MTFIGQLRRHSTSIVPVELRIMTVHRTSDFSLLPNSWQVCILEFLDCHCGENSYATDRPIRAYCFLRQRWEREFWRTLRLRMIWLWS